MRSTMIHFLSLCLIVYLLMGLMLFFMQGKMIFYPTQALSHAYETIKVESQGEMISCTVLNGDKKDAIIYFGGNAETVLGNAPDFERLFPNHAIYLVNYRGYGESTGIPSELALYADAVAIYDKVSSEYENISVIGRSLGSGVATYLAVERDIHKLVLVTPFDSIQSIAQRRFPIYPMSILLRHKFLSSQRAPKINTYVLVLAAEKDEVISSWHTQRLIDAFKSDLTETLTIRNAGHNDISNYREYYQAMTQFIKNK